MEILEGFDLTASYRDAAELAGCSPNTVARFVAGREAGTLVPGRAERRASVIDEFLPKLEELVERSKGKIRADVAHDKCIHRYPQLGSNSNRIDSSFKGL